MGPTLLRRWFLPLSLALNVFLGTVIVMHPRPHRPEPPPPRQIAERIAAALPAADGAILLEVFAAHAEMIEHGHRQQHGTPERVRAALAAASFDPEAVRAAFDDHRAARQTMDDALAAIIIETASRISPEGRAKLAKWEPPRPPGPPPRPPGG